MFQWELSKRKIQQGPRGDWMGNIQDLPKFTQARGQKEVLRDMVDESNGYWGVKM